MMVTIACNSEFSHGVADSQVNDYRPYAYKDSGLIYEKRTFNYAVLLLVLLNYEKRRIMD